ncbi:tumor necrosis factor receptor superfamily member 4 [Xenopus tropicalis]|uniref:TNF receptor superfamily member 4 n=1 Tax=Xenopus tropicalis TaxID=8364 RepID=A0A6I8RH35_XENTR|nr:tumor necrosis factor receptor superfamily member 4 [Xenopus tropicalis]
MNQGTKAMAELCLLVALWILPLLTTNHAVCPSHQSSYFTGADKEICCDYCAAGEEMKARCTSNNPKPTCEPCPEGFFNQPKTIYKCRVCNPCDKSSIELKPCDKSSDAVCKCPAGSEPKNDKETACLCNKGNHIVANQCVPCPQGHFSREDNSICRPWTNCSATGEEQQEPGSSTEDVKCSRPKILPSQVFRSSTSTKAPVSGKATTSHPRATEGNIVFNNATTVNNSSTNWKFLSFILIAVILLMVSATIFLIMFVHMCQRKEKRNFRGCRIPIQEVTELSKQMTV